MSDPESSKVFLFDNSDPEMQRAYENARASFRYFWREASWERRRIVPALDMACVKAPFTDGNHATKSKETPDVEHMWMSEIGFDGKHVSGVLLNSPNWLKSVKEGDSARIKLNEISDWMYAISGVVYGAYTVNLIRSRMGRKERQEHDNAWGLDFGDPARIRVVPEPKQEGGLLKRWFGPKPAANPEGAEHPASEGMAEKLKEQLAKDPNIKSVRDDKGWTFLHQEALAGNLATVQALLQAGADRNAVTNDGLTPLQLAKTLNWDKVVAVLSK